MSRIFTFLCGQSPILVQALMTANAELEYYIAYDPDVVNCAIAYSIFKPVEVTIVWGIEFFYAYFTGEHLQ